MTDFRLPTTNSRFCLFAHKIIQVPSLSFCRPADLTLSLPCVEDGCLVLQSLDFFSPFRRLAFLQNEPQQSMILTHLISDFA